MGESAVIKKTKPCFREKFAGGPIKRIGAARFLRNVLVAIGNSGRADLVEAAGARLADESALVRGAAVWALARLMPADAFAALAAERMTAETDAEVAAEWRAALGDSD